MGDSARFAAVAGIALATLLPCESIRAATTTAVLLDIVARNGGHTMITHECAGNACSLPSNGTPLPIPYPIATVDATDGVLRGRMRVRPTWISATPRRPR